MIVLGKHNTAKIEPLVASENGQVSKYYISSGNETVGFLEFHREIHEWAVNTACGFSMTSGFLSQVWTAIIADLELQVSSMKGEDSG